VLGLAGDDACKPIDHAEQIDQCANYALLEFIGDKGFVIFKPQEFFSRTFFNSSDSLKIARAAAASRSSIPGMSILVYCARTASILATARKYIMTKQARALALSATASGCQFAR
jgi:hypothetical protein